MPVYRVRVRIDMLDARGGHPGCEASRDEVHASERGRENLTGPGTPDLGPRMDFRGWASERSVVASWTVIVIDDVRFPSR